MAMLVITRWYLWALDSVSATVAKHRAMVSAGDLLASHESLRSSQIFQLCHCWSLVSHLELMSYTAFTLWLCQNSY